MRHFLFSVIIITVLSGCSRGPHFISDTPYRESVEKQFNIQKELAKNRSGQLFSVFNNDLTLQEQEALKFLYAYMPLSDLADYTGEFYLANVRASLAARDTFSWGKTVPEDLFRHFVLPIRVNNENLDTSRLVFFRELRDRLRNRTMKEAILEVNHWCHEKVNYRGTDGRTSAPLATVKTAYGRCGEESTFTVAALRSVGIPARQCYTPRWAHTDDNHAWVEAWADGKWYYIGACEPEPELDMAWFTGPAKRAMLVNTNVFGAYKGPEEVLLQDDRFTRINVLSNYTQVKRLFVRVLDRELKPCDSATVEFQLYNYAEFYPLQRVTTGIDGLASLETGLGDLLIWAAKDGNFGYSKADVRTKDTVPVILDKTKGYTGMASLDLVPPAKQEFTSAASDSLQKVNGERLAAEDRLRTAYTETFIDSARAFRLAETLKLNPDTLWKVLHTSRGNWQDMVSFMQSVPEAKKSLIFPLLLNVSEKDLHDVTPEALSDHLEYSQTYPSLATDPQMFAAYILNPRFDNEFLKPWKHLFQLHFSKEFVERSRQNPEVIAAWVKDSVMVNKTANWGRAPLTPVGVFELRVADPASRNIFFTALCRSFGIPARIETSTRNPQYFANGTWTDVWFDEKPQEGAGRVPLTLQIDRSKKVSPEYYIHYTVEEFRDGFYRSLDYETDPAVKVFPCTLQVPAGSYLLVTGNRMEDGTVLADLTFFDLPAGSRAEETITLRKDPSPLRVYGHLDLKKIFTTPPAHGIIIAYIDPNQEPTRHLLADLKAKKKEFSDWNGEILLVCPDEGSMKNFLVKNREDLPSNAECTFQGRFPMTHMGTLAKTGSNVMPVVYRINPGGDVLYLSEGYHIGTGDDLLKGLKE